MLQPTNARRINLTFGMVAVAMAVFLGLPASNAHATQVYVSVAGSDTVGNGTAGAPYATVQQAIDAAVAGDDVRVGPGTFDGYVDMKDHVSVYGSGAASTTLRGTESGPVVTAAGVGAGTTLSGFTITGGNGGYGGVWSWWSDLTIAGNTIVGNAADNVGMGGGICCSQRSTGTIINNTIVGNSAYDGGGIACDFFSSPIISNNDISGNTAASRGGGIFCYFGSAPTVVNNTITRNTAVDSGGGIFCRDAWFLTIRNSTVYGNRAGSGGGIYCENPDQGSPEVTNCIVWDNGDDPVNCATTYTCAENATESLGEGNIAVAPSFVATETSDFHLNADSPCINAGTSVYAPNTDKDGAHRPRGRAFDMGAYEFDAPGTMKPVYRFLNLENGFYLWSADESETDTIVRTLQGTWFLEGPAYQVFTIANTAPLWRFLNLRGGFYLYTADPGERDTIVRTLANEWRLEGPAYNVSRASSGRPVWRFRNRRDGTYLLSADPSERDTIVRTLQDTWQLEGPAFYIAP